MLEIIIKSKELSPRNVRKVVRLNRLRVIPMLNELLGRRAIRQHNYHGQMKKTKQKNVFR